MAAAISRHYTLLDEAIANHRGVRPVEQGEGDSVVGAFSRASDAIRAAIDAQRALTVEAWPTEIPLRVRMAVHTGEAPDARLRQLFRTDHHSLCPVAGHSATEDRFSSHRPPRC